MLQKGIHFVKYQVMKGKILVADDAASIRDIFRIILLKEGYEPELKEDANDLLIGKFNAPDLFLIDKLLSGMDGLDICRFLKSNIATKNIPVVMISALPDIGSSPARLEPTIILKSHLI